MVWGFIIGLALTALICVLVMSGTGKQLSILSWIVAIVMFLGLSIESNKLINAISGRSEISDFVNTIVGSISECLDSDNSSVISYSEANQIALGCKMVLPGWGRYFSAQDFQGESYSDIPCIVSDRISHAMSRQVWNMVGWILLTSIVGTVLIVVFSVQQRRSRGGAKKKSQSARRNTKYRSRRK